MEKTKITFWGGLRTIGGNIAEVTYGKDRIIFDFGLVYDPAKTIVQPEDRKDSYVLDLLKLSAIPPINGIYSEKDLQGPTFSIEKPIPEEQSDYRTAVFISHLHLDHMGAMDTISPNIPVYMTEQSKQLLNALEQIGEGLSNDREVSGISFHEPITIGNITVTPLPVDHDVIGASSFLIETPDVKLYYTGDFRMHGEHPEYVEESMAFIKNKKIDLLLIEGTSIGSDQKKEHSLCRKEGDIQQAAIKILQDQDGLVFFNMYHRNVERIRQFIESAKETNRKIVFEPETAYIVKEFLDDDDFFIYEKTKHHLTSAAFQALESIPSIAATDINQHPKRFLLQNSFSNLSHLLDLNLKNSAYLHTNGIPLGLFDPAYETLQSVLHIFGVEYYTISVSGHAKENDLLHIVDQVKPKLVIPWHSRHPEQFTPLDQAQPIFLPELGKEYVLETDLL